MRFVTVLIWSLIMGQMIAYLGAALGGSHFTPFAALIGSFVLALAVFILGENITTKKKPRQNKKSLSSDFFILSYYFYFQDVRNSFSQSCL